ncbi:MAG: hypothetical protein FWF28_10340 [Micrococcales bacterium]|nr:hypothetical protein [Micrococcales bacterium]
MPDKANIQNLAADFRCRQPTFAGLNAEQVGAWLATTCAAQHVPVLISDPTTLDKAAFMFTPNIDARQSRPAAARRHSTAANTAPCIP